MTSERASRPSKTASKTSGGHLANIQWRTFARFYYKYPLLSSVSAMSRPPPSRSSSLHIKQFTLTSKPNWWRKSSSQFIYSSSLSQSSRSTTRTQPKAHLPPTTPPSPPSLPSLPPSPHPATNPPTPTPPLSSPSPPTQPTLHPLTPSPTSPPSPQAQPLKYTNAS